MRVYLLALAAAAGFVVLLLGALVYVTDRDPAKVLLMPAALSWPGARDALRAIVRDSFPSFAHAFGFSLLTVAALASTRRQALWACAFWLVADLALEFMQATSVRSTLLGFGLLPGEPLAWWPRGRFDPLDLLAVALGAAAAGLLVSPIRRRDGGG
jgi:hypothetical protein